MQVVVSQAELHKIVEGWKNHTKIVGFVPTMGALHEGHLALVRYARNNSDRVVVSIFVNPTQFAPHEDFDAYPRQEAQDLAKLEEFGVHVVYLPNADEIYPDGFDTELRAGKAAIGLESDFRPHFFDGVVNVVSRLFSHVKPDVAVFGEKDFQQLAVVTEMVDTYKMPTRIVGVPIVRDEEGLALSSRNAYLSPDQLKIARTLNKVLFETAKTKDTEAAKKQLLENGFDKVDYVDIRGDRLLAAAWIGKTRLIDNVALS